jgi:hypothetical protein
MPSFICKDVINLTVRLPTRRRPRIFINVTMWEHYTPDRIFDIAKLLLRGIALGLGLDDRWFESQQDLGIFLFTVSRPPLGPTTPPIQWVPGALSLG